MHAEVALQQLLEDSNKISDASEAELLGEQAARKLAELYRHRQVVRLLGSAGWRAAINREHAGQMTMEIFGEPQRETFAHLLGEVRGKAERQAATGSAIAQELLDRLGSLQPETEAPNYELSDKTLETLRGDIYELFPGIETVLLDQAEGEISPEDSVAHFQRMLAFLGMTTDGWQARLSEGKAAGTSSSERHISIGRNRSAFTPARLNALMLHEAVGHGFRAFKAQQQDKQVLKTPLPDFLPFEEGLGTALEQIMTDEKRMAGKQYYLSLGLQLGLDRQDGQARGFRDTYEILWRKAVVEAAVNEEVTDEVIAKAQRTAEQQCMRTTRGTALDARDISYFDGARKANEWLNTLAELPESERLAQWRWVLSARFDPTRQSHVAVVGAPAHKG